MKRVRIAKSIGLIGLVAASLLLCSAQSFQPAPKLYRANQEDYESTIAAPGATAEAMVPATGFDWAIWLANQRAP